MKKLFAMTLAILPALIQSAYADQNLVDIYQIALNRDPEIASAINSNKAAQELQIQGRALLLPTLSISSNASHATGTIEYLRASPFTPGRQTYQTLGWTANLNQPLFRMQSYLQYLQSQIQVTQSDQQLVFAYQDLMTRTSQAYFDILLAQDKIDLINAQKAAIGHQLEQAKANFEAGVSTITDVNDAKAKYDSIIAQEVAALNDFEAKKRALQSIIGDVPADLVKVSPDLVVAPVEPLGMDQWVEIAEKNNLNLMIQKQTLEIARKEVDKQKAGHYPTADLVSNYSDSRADGGVQGFGTDSQQGTISIQVQLPLFQGFATESKIRQSIANEMKAQEDVEAARRKADLDTRQAFLNMMGSVAQVKAYEQALASSQSQLDSTNLAYEVGVRNSVDVLNAQQQFFSAKRDLLQSRYIYLLSIIKLKQAAGILTEADLVDINNRLTTSVN